MVPLPGLRVKVAPPRPTTLVVNEIGPGPVRSEGLSAGLPSLHAGNVVVPDFLVAVLCHSNPTTAERSPAVQALPGIGSSHTRRVSGSGDAAAIGATNAANGTSPLVAMPAFGVCEIDDAGICGSAAGAACADPAVARSVDVAASPTAVTSAAR